MTFNNVVDHGLRFIYGTSKGVLALWLVSMLIDLVLFSFLGINVLAMLDPTTAWSMLGSVADIDNSIFVILILFIFNDGFRRALWYPAKRVIVDGESPSVLEAAVQAATRVFRAVFVHEVVMLFWGFVLMICWAMYLVVEDIPVLLVTYILGPAYFIILTEHRPFMDGFTEAIRWSYRHWIVLFCGQAAGWVIGAILYRVFDAVWVTNSVFVAIGGATLYLAVSWIAWVCESAAYFAVLKEES